MCYIDKADVKALKQAHNSIEMIWGIVNCKAEKTVKSGRLTNRDLATIQRHIDKIDKVILDILNSSGVYPL